MNNLTFRELTRTIGETDPSSGQTTRDETVYEYGAKVDGVFVRIGTFTEGQVADARNRADAERERGGQQPQSSTAHGGEGARQTQPPDEVTPASEARTSADAG
jgi:hypothetical protein